jgi:hypothetical protein
MLKRFDEVVDILGKNPVLVRLIEPFADVAIDGSTLCGIAFVFNGRRAFLRQGPRAH